MPRFPKEVKILMDAIHDAMKVTEWFQKEGFKTYNKQDSTPVTYADIASQVLIVSRIKENFPEDMIIAEEDQEFLDKSTDSIIKRCFQEIGLDSSIDIKEMITHKGNDPHRQWTIDPIDGTEGFLNHLVYAIGVCFMEVNIPKMSIIGVPHYNADSFGIFLAEDGNGARYSKNGAHFEPIHVSQQDDMKKIRMCHSLHYDEPWVLAFAKKMGINNLVQIDSMAKLSMVADGTADLYIKPIHEDHSFSWDFAPGYLLVKESGGKITDLKGKSLQFKDEHMICNTPGLIASNESIHELIIDELQKMDV